MTRKTLAANFFSRFGGASLKKEKSGLRHTARSRFVWKLSKSDARVLCSPSGTEHIKNSFSTVIRYLLLS